VPGKEGGNPEPAHEHSIEMKMPFGGVPGQTQNYIVTVNGSPPQGAPGRYKVVFTLSRDEHLPTPRTTVPFEAELPGDSHVVLPPGAFAERGGSKFVSLRVAALTPPRSIRVRWRSERGGSSRPRRVRALRR
jgi:hypothetical protein